MKNKRLQFGILSILLIFCVLCFSLFYLGHRDGHDFRKLSASIFTGELEQDTLSLHYTVSEPEKYGIKEQEVSFPCFSPDDYQQSRTQLTHYLNTLEKIDPGHLSSRDALSYTNLYSYLANRLEGCGYEYYPEPLSPGSGLQTQLLILLAEYSLQDKDDIETYLALLKEIAPYFESVLAYEQQKAENGLFMSDATLNKVLSQCGSVITKESIQDESHFMVRTFAERLKPIMQNGVITAQEYSTYFYENTDILSNEVYPAYSSLQDGLALLTGSGKNTMGLFYLDRGKDYYTYLLRSQTGSDKSVAELKQLLLQKLEEYYNGLVEVSREISALMPTGENNFSTLLPLESPKDMLMDLRKQMQRDYPALPVMNFKISCQVKKVDESLQNYVSPAFYLTPPIDNIKNNVIYINDKNKPDSLDLYTTLAHEGYPGHLYQSVYHLLSAQEQNGNPVDSILYYGGYVEGWAFYVENNAYEYAKAILPNTPERELTAAYFEACRLNRNLQLCLFSLLDIAIHHDGADFEKAKQVLQGFGIADERTARNIYEYIVEEPTNYPKYCIGFLEILECREEAQKLWNENYSDLKFHTLFLDTGPTSFANLSNQIQDFNSK